MRPGMGLKDVEASCATVDASAPTTRHELATLPTRERTAPPERALGSRLRRWLARAQSW